jgi:hypothetical protein
MEIDGNRKKLLSRIIFLQTTFFNLHPFIKLSTYLESAPREDTLKKKMRKLTQDTQEAEKFQN